MKYINNFLFLFLYATLFYKVIPGEYTTYIPGEYTTYIVETVKYFNELSNIYEK